MTLKSGMAARGNSLEEPTSGSRLPVAIIGGGFGGIATAVKLVQAGIDDFVVFEPSPRPGGTWYSNTYPGCEVDVPSPLYSFSFMRHTFSGSHAHADELQQYAEATLDRFGIRGRFRFGVRVEEIEWDDDLLCHRVRTSDGTESLFSVVVSCVGSLSNPKHPAFATDEFEGPCFHTANWDHDQELAGKRIALVGTGSSAIQITSRLAEIADHLYVFQREPGWVVPKFSRRYGRIERRMREKVQLINRAERLFYYVVFDVWLRGAYRVGGFTNRMSERLCTWFIDKSISDPELKRIVTPAYPFGCKRPIIDDNYYEALSRDNVTVVPHGVTGLTPQAVCSADGESRPVDAVVLATGFQIQSYLASFRVLGVGGRDLHDTWADTPRACLGMTVPGFPNFFITYGPNTNGGNSIIFMLERQAEAIVRLIKQIRRDDVVIDTRPKAFERWSKWISKQTGNRCDVATLCHNYYLSPSGQNVTQWPRGSFDYWALSRVLPSVLLRASRRTAAKPVAMNENPDKLYAEV